MKLLMFIPSMRGGGAERVMAVLCNGLSQRGHEVVLSTDLSEGIKYPLDSRIKLVALTERKYRKSLYGKISYNFYFYRRIRKIIKEIRPDAVISFLYILNPKVILASRGLHIPVISSEHTNFKVKRTWLKTIRREYINKLADRVTILTKADFDYVGAKLKNKVIVPDPLPFLPPEKDCDRKKVILAVGYLNRYKEKGFDRLIETWSHIAHKYPDWKLCIAGTGNSESVNNLQQLCVRYKVEDRVQFPGFIDDMQSFYQRASIFVLPSQYEGFSMALIEAMSQGCAAVSLNCPSGPEEIISNWEDGILVGADDFGALEENISYLIEDENLRKKLSHNAIKNMQRYSVENIMNIWENLLHEVVEKKA